MPTRQRPTSGLDRVTEIVPKFPPAPFGLTTRKWPRSHFSIYTLNLMPTTTTTIYLEIAH